MSGAHHHGSHAGHGHGSESRERAEAHQQGRLGDRRRMVFALVLTSLLFVLEVVGGVLSHSLSLLSDAGHMLSDVGAQGLSLAALVIAARPSDRRRTYGYYRIEILAALANGVALFVLSGWIFWSALHRLREAPQPVETHLMMGVAAAGLVANLAAAWLLSSAQSLNAKGAYLHVMQDTLSSVAVLLGGAVMAVLAGVRGIYLVDPLLSIGIGLFVNIGAWRLVRDAVDVLLETVPFGIDLDEVSAAIRSEPHIIAVHDLHLWTITSGIFALSAHVVVEASPEPDSGHDELLGRVNQRLRSAYNISHTTIQIETAAYDYECHNCDPVPAPSGTVSREV